MAVTQARNEDTDTTASNRKEVAGVYRADKGPMTITVVEDPAALSEYATAWQALAQEAIEPNVYYEPWMLLPAVRFLTAEKPPLFVLVFRTKTDDPEGQPSLCGLFPLERGRRFLGLPVNVLNLFSHSHCYLRTPLLRRGYARETLAAFFEWAASDTQGAAVLNLARVSGDGPFYHALLDFLHERSSGAVVTEAYTRAFLLPERDAETYIQHALSGKHRRQNRRLERQLQERGELRYAQLESESELDGWLNSFLDLEARGWKGKAGTALACDDKHRLFFVTAATEAFRRGQLLFFALQLDGRPIAMDCNFRSGIGGFSFKPAFDESFSPYSPGVLLYLEEVRRFHEMEGLRWVDSCTDPNNELLNRLWCQRRIVTSLLVSSGRRTGDFLLALRPLREWLGRRWRR